MKRHCELKIPPKAGESIWTTKQSLEIAPSTIIIDQEVILGFGFTGNGINKKKIIKKLNPP
jgi:hypothetical protein